MVTTLTGNSYALQHELRSMVAAFTAAHGNLALEQIDGQEAEFNRILEALTSLPFLATKKMVVLRTGGANKQFAEQASALLANLPESTELLLVEPKLDKRLAYYKYLKSKTTYHDYPELDYNGLARWLTTVARDRGVTLQSADARYLVERVGTNQLLLAQELEKLSLYSPQITRQTIDLLTEATPQSTIFQLLEAAFAGNAQRALALYKEQRALKVEPPQIIAMLAWQLHIVALIKAGGERSPETIAAEAKLNPFVVRKSQAIARHLTLSQLKRLVAELLLIDARSKRTTIDTDEALQYYLLKLTQ